MMGIDLYTKTNRYCDLSINKSAIAVDNARLIAYISSLSCGEANEAKYRHYIEILKNDEKNIEQTLGFDLTDHSDFCDYFTYLRSFNRDVDCYFIKDDKMLEIFQSNIPKNTIAAAGCSALDELLVKYSIREISALTRLFEDDDWREIEFKYINNLSADDYESRCVVYFIFDSSKFIIDSSFSKIVWDDKICGSIFSYSSNGLFKTDVPFLRTASELFHFYYEFKAFKSFMGDLIESGRIDRFNVFLKNKICPDDFFDPHALSEAWAWKKATIKLFEIFPNLSDVWNKNNLIVYSNENYILSNNIIDYIRALSSCKFPDIATVTSIIIRYDILCINYTYQSVYTSVMSSLDRKVIDLNKLKSSVELLV